MSDAVTATSSLLRTQSLMSASQSQLSKLSEQLTTGQVGQSVTDYGASASTLLNLQASQKTEQGYVANNTTIQGYLTAYDATIAHLQSDATTLQKVLGSTQTNSPSSIATLAATVKGLLTDINATLNTQVGDRYIFSGSRYTTAPVGNLNTLPPLNTPVAVSGAASNGSGLVRLTLASTAGLTSGQQITVSGVNGTTEANGTWTVNVIDATHVDLVGSTFANAYTSGGSAVATSTPPITPLPTAVSGAANNGSGLIRLAVGSTAGLSTGQQIAVTGVNGTTEANGTWTINVIDATHIDLVGSTFTNAYTSGGSAVSALPAYDASAPGFGTPVGSPYAQQTAVIAQNEPAISYGISSNDPTIQSLIYALQNAQAATSSGLTSTQVKSYLSNANNLVSDAINGSTTNSAVTGFSGSSGLLAQVTNTQGQIANANAVHTQTLATLTTQATSITAIDSATIAEELSALQSQLQATYKVTASTLNLSLLNYIS